MLSAALCLAVLASAQERVPVRRVEVAPSPGTVLLGGEGAQVVELNIRVFDDRPERLADADVIVVATAGEVVDVREVAPGRFAARLLRPEERFPQLAVISAADLSEVALGEPPVVGTAVVAYSARIPLKGHTEANASMEVRIGGRRYGPARADDHGQFAIPVTVRPGELFAEGISRDALGNTARSRINMYLPEVRRVHGFAYPRELVADGHDEGWLFFTTVSHSGAPEDVPIRVRAARGVVGEVVRVGQGLFRATYRAPKGVGAGYDTATVVRQGREALVRVRLTAGAPARLEARIEPQPALADGESETTVEIDVLDPSGNRVAGQRVTLHIDDAEVPVVEQSPGIYRASLPARSTVGRARARIEVRPVSTGCRRARLIRGTESWHVVDVRGVGCAGRFRVAEPGRLPLTEGVLGSHGFLPGGSSVVQAFAAGARLEIAGAEPRRIAVHGGSSPSAGIHLAEPMVAERWVWWQPLVPVSLRIHETGRSRGRVSLRILAEGVERPRERLRVSVSAGEVSVVGHGQGYLDVVLAGAVLPVEVAVTDSETGVGTWARVH